MSYFSNNYARLQYPIGAEGLRVAQAGAIHSIAAHFTVGNDPALVVMPTGSGKTAVLFATPIVLQAERALVITPSRLVRNQIAEGAETLAVLKKMGVLPENCPPPRVRQIEAKLGTEAAWNDLRDADLVIATPNCTSPEMDGVAKAPADMFDVILIDEAHHAAAKTWAALLEHFPNARRVLFTATPYRRDKKLIKAKAIYTYPLRKAYEDKIFGKVTFVPVDPVGAQTADEAIARKTESLFRADRAAGLKHAIMVRTDSKARAEELKGVYASHTSLKLRVIHSEHSAAFVAKTIERLRESAESLAGMASDDSLDGIICVDMMGEGFDFPYLKIAAVHTPHRSLAVTLQFIGRFARTSARDLGEARFVAVPKEIAGETEELFHEGAVWSEIVPNLSEARVQHEQAVGDVISSFTKIPVHRVDHSDIEFDLGSIRPFCHVKIYAVSAFSGLGTPPAPTGNFEIVQYDVSEDNQCAILLLREQTFPRWTDYEELGKTEHDFVLTFYDETSRHLFICSSRRKNVALYEAMGKHYSNDTHRILSLFEINRVLHDLKNPTLFQVGMKNTVPSSNSESYQTKMGPKVQGAISSTDCNLYHRGHVFLSADSKDGACTIGYSSASKVWSNTSLRVPEIILWCRMLGSKLVRTDKVTTNTNLDLLGVGEPVTKLPDDVIAVSWNDDVYKCHIDAHADGGSVAALHDVSLEIEGMRDNSLRIRLNHHNMSGTLRLEVVRSNVAAIPEGGLADVTISRKDETYDLEDYLTEFPLQLYLSDFGRISGSTYYPRDPSENGVFPEDCILIEDWESHGIDITLEFKEPALPGPDNSIHGFLKRSLPQRQSGVVIYDHGSGEIGDFLTVVESTDRILFGIYHCKGSAQAKPGARVSDVYEVAGQVVKSLIHFKTVDHLRKKVDERLAHNPRFLQGDYTTLRGLFAKTRSKQAHFEIYCVQPGIGRSQMSDKISNSMAAAKDYVARSCQGGVKFIISR